MQDAELGGLSAWLLGQLRCFSVSKEAKEQSSAAPGEFGMRKKAWEGNPGGGG